MKYTKNKKFSSLDIPESQVKRSGLAYVDIKAQLSLTR